jgi:hypothetical protein
VLPRTVEGVEGVEGVEAEQETEDGAKRLAVIQQIDLFIATVFSAVCSWKEMTCRSGRCSSPLEERRNKTKSTPIFSTPEE